LPGVAHGEGDRLPGPDRDAPEDLLSAELGECPTHEVVRTDRHTARGDQHVAGEPLLERSAGRALIVPDGVDDGDVCAGRLELRGEHHGVRLEDLARRERSTRRTQLAPGREHGDAWAPCAPDGCHSRGRKRAQLCWTERFTALDDDVARARIASARTDVVPDSDPLDRDDAVAGRALDRNDRVCTGRDDGARGDDDRLAGAELARLRPAGGRVTNDRERTRCVCSAHRVAVHRRAVERGEIGRRRCRFGHDPARSLHHGNVLSVERQRPCEHEREGIGDPRQVAHWGSR
jgi:hypothetical protein